MSLDFGDIIDLDMMHEPPTFVTTVRIDGKSTVVITSGIDFPALVVEWPELPAEERATDFWALGLLHLVEVEVAKLPPEPRAEATAKIKSLHRHDPRGLASKVAAVVREAGTDHPGIAKVKIALTKEEMETYRWLLIVRATAPYTGDDNVTIFDIGGGLVAA